MDHVFLWRGALHVSCNLPCATHGIGKHGVATRVTAMQATCLGKYLAMPYHKNTMKEFSLSLNGNIALILYLCPLLQKYKVIFSVFCSPVF